MPAPTEGWVVVHLDELLHRRGMSAAELARAIGITQANVSILRTGKAKAIRFTTLVAICAALDCQPGDLLTLEHDDHPASSGVRMGGSTVVLSDAGDREIEVIKAIRETTGANLRAAKLMVDTVPSVISSGISRLGAEELLIAVQAAGGNAEIN